MKNKKVKEIKEEPEQSEDQSIPLPPGFIIDPIDFTSNKGKKIINETFEKRENSLLWSPLLNMARGILILLFASGMYLMTNLMSVFSLSITYLWTAFSFKEKLTFQGRMKMILIGFALLCLIAFLFVRRLLPRATNAAPIEKYVIFLEK